jgi:hypothetical protein
MPKSASIRGQIAFFIPPIYKSAPNAGLLAQNPPAL